MTVNNNVSEQKKSKIDFSLEGLLRDVCLLPKWEMIKSMNITKKKIFVFKSIQEVNLWRKFSSKHLIEKYSLKTLDGKVLGNIDLKVYKDSVYIINLDVKLCNEFNQVIDYLFQVAVEKSLYNTTEKEVKYNMLLPIVLKSKTKKALLNSDFIIEPTQNEYEKEMFGETFSLKADISSYWNKKIKEMPILINK